MKYKILEHPSELKIIVYGKTLEELFSNAVLAMGEIMARESGTGNWELGVKEKVEIKSADINSLLVDFLSEILAQGQINKCVYQVSSLKFQDLLLEAELISYPVDRFDEDIKAVTYEDLDIKQVDGIWQTIIIFDI